VPINKTLPTKYINVMKPTYLLIFIALFSFSCKQKTENPVQMISMNHTRPVEELKELIMLKGDTVAYDELAIAYMDEKYDEEYLIYSLIMANKYNYPPAYYNVYYCLTSVFEHHSYAEIDEITKEMAIRYLKRGVELKDAASTKYLGYLYLEGKYVKKDTILGKKLEKEGRILCGF
jgi:TPR repeat protein